MEDAVSFAKLILPDKLRQYVVRCFDTYVAFSLEYGKYNDHFVPFDPWKCHSIRDISFFLCCVPMFQRTKESTYAEMLLTASSFFSKQPVLLADTATKHKPIHL